MKQQFVDSKSIQTAKFVRLRGINSKGQHQEVLAAVLVAKFTLILQSIYLTSTRRFQSAKIELSHNRARHSKYQ